MLGNRILPFAAYIYPTLSYVYFRKKSKISKNNKAFFQKNKVIEKDNCVALLTLETSVVGYFYSF